DYQGTASVLLAGSSRRIDVWTAFNASRADPNTGTNVSFGASQIHAGYVVDLFEFSGAPLVGAVDFVQSATGSGTSAALSSTATTSDFAVGALLLSGTGNALFSVTPPVSMVALTGAATSTTRTDQYSQDLYPAIGNFSAGAVSATWSWTGAQLYAAVIVGF